MPRFSFTAYDDKGARATGEIEAESREAALASLFRQGRYPLDISRGEDVQTTRWWNRELFGGPHLSQTHLTHLTRELATLIKAELPLDEAIRIVTQQPLMNTRARLVIAGVLSRVLEGASLAEALSAQGAFPEYYWRIVHAGESSGTLGQVFDELARFLERSTEFRARISAALLYPILLLVAAGVALVVIVTVLIPTIVPLFKDAGVQPPLLIRFLADTQAAIAAHWGLALFVGGGSLAGLIALLRNQTMRIARDRAVLRMPFLARFVQSGQTATMARTLATLIRNGVPMLQAMQIAANVLSNRAMRTAVETSTGEMKEGASLAGSLGRSNVFPELSLRLIGVGERSGQLEVMLSRVAEIYDATLQRDLVRITSLLTPILTIAIGVMVGSLLLSVMAAIVSLNDLALQ